MAIFQPIQRVGGNLATFKIRGAGVQFGANTLGRGKSANPNIFRGNPTVILSGRRFAFKRP